MDDRITARFPSDKTTDIHECPNCELVLEVEEEGTIIGDNKTNAYLHQDFGLHLVDKLHTRLTWGEEVPSGECPECGALTYYVEKEEVKP